MNDLILSMNDILKKWLDKYDLSYNIPLQFVLDSNQRVSSLGKAIDLSAEVDLESANFDAKNITFALSDGCRIFIDISWPEDEAPRVNSILVGYIFES